MKQQTQNQNRIAVIGGGPAGMMAALTAAHAGVSVDLIERNDKPGKKILSTGNGRCNFTNRNMTKDAYFGSLLQYYDVLYEDFGLSETLDFFADLGMLVTERRGCLYPASGQAATVRTLLLAALEDASVRILAGQPVVSVTHIDAALGGFFVRRADEKPERYDRVILACGGKAAPTTGSDGSGFSLAKSLGHQTTTLVPGLVPLICEEKFCKNWAGIRTEGTVTLFVNGEKVGQERGELQLTNYGISGIPVFDVSRQADLALADGKNVEAELDFLPWMTAEEETDFWQERFSRFPNRRMGDFLTGLVNDKLGILFLRLSRISPATEAGALSDAERKNLANLYRHLRLHIQASRDFDQAQVTAGGIPASEVKDTLESKLVPGLYFAGEILDMDGICGGYNLQWAWTSGHRAGKHI